MSSSAPKLAAPSLPPVRPTSQFSPVQQQEEDDEVMDPELEASVAAKRHLVEKQAAELRQLTDRIAAMEQREAALKKALGGS